MTWAALSMCTYLMTRDPPYPHARTQFEEYVTMASRPDGTHCTSFIVRPDAVRIQSTIWQRKIRVISSRMPSSSINLLHSVILSYHLSTRTHTDHKLKLQ